MSTDPPSSEASGLRAVIAVSSNKGGVGKTTLSTNLAIYFRALREEQPVALVGLDDQQVIDRMFSLRPLGPGDGNLKHAWAERNLDRVLQLGQYGVHFTPSPPDVSLLKKRAEDPTSLRRMLDRSAFGGIFVLDTKSDLEALTRNALHAADRILVPVADGSSLEEASKTFDLLERARLDPERARVVFTLVDRRSRLGTSGTLYERLAEEVRRRGWPRYETSISRSPRVESLNSGTRRPLSVLHHARGTAVHSELRDLAIELLLDLEGRAEPPQERPAEATMLWARRGDSRARPRPASARGHGTPEWLRPPRRS